MRWPQREIEKILDCFYSEIMGLYLKMMRGYYILYVSMVRKVFILEGYKGIGYMMNRLNQALPVCLQAGRQNSTW